MNESKTSREKVADKLYIVIRIAILYRLCSSSFRLNPARISGLINETCPCLQQVSYSTLIDGFGRSFKKG